MLYIFFLNTTSKVWRAKKHENAPTLRGLCETFAAPFLGTARKACTYFAGPVRDLLRDLFGGRKIECGAFAGRVRDPSRDLLQDLRGIFKIPRGTFAVRLRALFVAFENCVRELGGHIPRNLRVITRGLCG